MVLSWDVVEIVDRSTLAHVASTEGYGVLVGGNGATLKRIYSTLTVLGVTESA